MAWKQLFAKKSLDVLLAEMAGEHRLRRVLGPVTLSSLGIGAIIGTGIFVLTGVAARQHAGPGLIVSFIVAGMACAFAALCYAEFASMAPIAGSAYTYAYVSLGELIAWIIGWDLVLEYAMSSATVANGWAHYFLNFLGMFKDKGGKPLLTIVAWMATDPFTAAEQHMDYRAAQTLRVESTSAVPYSSAGAKELFAKMDANADGTLTLEEYRAAHPNLNDAAGEFAKLAGGKPALAWEDYLSGVSRKSVSLPVPVGCGIVRVQDVSVTFTAESVKAVQGMLGEEEAAASIGRVQRSVEALLQYEPEVSPAEKLAKVGDGSKHGYEAYEQTPLRIGSLRITFNIVAIAIVTVITGILVIGIRESAGFNAAMVLVKIGAVLFVIVAGVGYIDASNWTPFMPYGWGGVLGGAAVIFFAYIGFDSVSTHAEEARNPKTDVPIGIISSLAVCTVLYIAVAAVITGMVPYPKIPLDAPIAGVFESVLQSKVAPVIISIGAITGITSVLLVMLLSQPRVLLAMARDGLLPFSFFGAVHPRFRTPHKATILTGIVCGLTASLFPLEALSHMVNIGTLFAFVVVCAAVWLMRRLNPTAERPFRTPFLHLIAPAGILLCVALMIRLGMENWMNWMRLIGWLVVGLVIYIFYGRRHSHLGKELRGEISLHGVSPAGTLDGPEA